MNLKIPLLNTKKRILSPRDKDKCLILLPAMVSSCDYTRCALLNFSKVSI